MKTIKRQQGMTIWGWLVIAILVGFNGLIAMKLVPVYMEYFSVKKSVGALKSEPNLSGMSRSQIYNILEKHFSIEGVRSVQKEHVNLVKGSKGKKVVVQYDVKIPIAYQLSILAEFNEELNTADTL